MRCTGISPARRAGLALLAAAPVLALASAAAPAAAAAARVELPSPNTYGLQGTSSPVDPGQQVALRVYLAGQHPAGPPAAALAAATPGSPAYARYLTPAQYQRRFGPTRAQTAAVTGWLTGQGMTVTDTTAHYIAVQATAAEVNSAFDTQVSQYVWTTTMPGYTWTSSQVGTVGDFSVPAALGADVASVTGIDETTVASSAASAPASPARLASPEGLVSPEGLMSRARSASPAASRTSAAGTSTTSAGYQCSQYWGQHTETVGDHLIRLWR
ncbi:MAG: protease pro-enzyme activation domain-containing protein [Trebonia sp.]